MNATLTFDLSQDEDRLAYLQAAHTEGARLALVDLREEFRRMRKYEDDDRAEALEKIFYQILESRGLDLERLVP